VGEGSRDRHSGTRGGGVLVRRLGSQRFNLRTARCGAGSWRSPAQIEVRITNCSSASKACASTSLATPSSRLDQAPVGAIAMHRTVSRGCSTTSVVTTSGTTATCGLGGLPQATSALRRGALTVEESEDKLRQNNVTGEDAAAILALTHRLPGEKVA
jgi:hypothetical protein